ncbi:SusC/RagA family TonB-linked outer membrane protein [Sphingobacterium sp. SRCM116780]|uniref:SusC/RagA family TonB-linked outer membrane protein n=1 Tax=Sphingobacterium sp. SRCM116780 TaxID=2907623 RepID=UPI001F3B0D66|nr:SusC/RagA family TonB-linked outer membrane protein [Sphingobacterium sp. SRCM116780]UIR57333.1 SusC/RagA family TonB-linked outer membrane protein [Sphingobacterium sp. SRCM116780]
MIYLYYFLSKENTWIIFFAVLLQLSTFSVSYSQEKTVFRGQVRSSLDGTAVMNASIKLKNNTLIVQTDDNGNFEFKSQRDTGTLVLQHLQYHIKEVHFDSYKKFLAIQLDPRENALEEVQVYNTGYYSIPKERATGSYELVDRKQLNQSLSSNLLSRLEGLTGALSFDRRTAITKESSNEQLNLRLRGVSTIMSNAQPLIIVNNFPFDGDIADINPNDVESLVFLKDAASAAIWGAKSGNGVIVIQLKTAKNETARSIQFSYSNRIGGKPDVFNGNRFISSPDFMELEKELFQKSYFKENNTTLLSPYVYLLFQHQKGLIDDEILDRQTRLLASTDIRKDASQYLYQNSIAKIANLSLSGGGKSHGYFLSFGYDHSRFALKGNEDVRYSFRADHSFQFTPKLSAQITTDYIIRKERTNAVSMYDQSGIVPADKLMIYPYASLINTDGSYQTMPIAFSPFYIHDFMQTTGRDWLFNPLQELELRDQTNTNNALRFLSSLKYKPIDGLTLSLQYNYNLSNGAKQNYYDKNSYYARNLINRYMQLNGAFIVPDGNIRHAQTDQTVKHTGRFQMDYHKTLVNDLVLTTLIGAELSENKATIEPNQILYNFNDDTFIGLTALDYTTYFPVRPEGSARIPVSGSQVFELTDRFISYYGLGSLNWKQRYLLTGSLRWDASNLFGVKTNQKGVPLWSIGTSWLIHRESFAQSLPFTELKLRATVGENGNINKNASAFPTAAFTIGSMTRLQEALLKTAGNPQLKWERVRTWNLGLDWAVHRNTLGGSIDIFEKDCYDLLGYKNADPTTGINPAVGGVKEMINYGQFQSRGIDINLYWRQVKLGTLFLNADLKISKNWNKVIDYDIKPTTILDYFQYIVPATSGKSRDILYAFPWYGLDAETGSPLVSDGTQLGTTYGSHVSSFDYEKLLQVGNSFPLWNGSFRNEWVYNNISLSFLFTWKGAYQFRRSSVNYQELMEKWNMHTDYHNRWQKKGDELTTNVPSVPTVLDSNRENYYSNSEILIEDGDHIRLQSINLNYRLPLAKKSIKIEIIAVAENLGMIWRKNKLGIDPEYHLNYYMPPKQFTVGLRTQF